MTGTTKQGQTKAPTRSGKSFLKWAGGKTRYADQLVALAPNYTGRYFEPFMGSAAVFFELNPKLASLSDLNLELVICFQQVAQYPEKIMELLDTMPNSPDYFYEVRAQDVTSLSDLERGARVIYLNKTSFRGLWRVNRKGMYNVPYGAYDRPYYNRKTLMAASACLENVEIKCMDFVEAINETQKGDWVYLDPPYIPLGGWADFKRYTSGQFGEDDHRRLAKAMLDASERGVFVTLSNSDTPTTHNIYADFRSISMATRRDINLQAKSRASTDIIFMNYEPPQQMRSVDTNTTLF